MPATGFRITWRISKSDADEAADGGDIGRDNKLAEKIAAIRGRRERHQSLLDHLDQTGEGQILLTNPDACAMAGVSPNVLPSPWIVPATASVFPRLSAKRNVLNSVSE